MVLIEMGLMEYFAIFWVIFCASIWLIIRKKRPEWIGLGSDFNKQKIDGVKYDPCQKCGVGRLAPIFHSFEKRHTITIPPGLVYVIGSPDEYKCTNCGYIAKGNQFPRRFTRISLAHRLPAGAATKILLKFSILIGLMAITVFFIGKWMD